MKKIDLLLFAQNFVSAFEKENEKLDYSVNSLKQIEDYISTTFKNSKPKKNSFFAEDTDSMTFAMGAYLGEVIRRNSRGVRWNNVETESPFEITQETPNGSVAFTIGKAFKRIYQGEEDNMHHFAVVMLKDLLKFEEDIPDDFYDEEDIRINNFGHSPVTIYSKEIEKNNGIVDHIYFDSGAWSFSSLNDSNSNPLEANFEYLFLDEVKLKHPEFADLIESQPTEKLRIVRQDDGTYRSQKEFKSLLFDSHTIPTYQGDMKLNIIQWTKFNFRKVADPIIFMIIGYLMMVRIHWFFGIILIAALLYSIWYWLMASNRFKGGDMNPGKVISLNPTLVAVASDMRKFTGDFPILKIIQTKLPKEDQKIGKVIPTVALYNDNPHGYPFWAEFHPVPVIHGIKDRNHIQQILTNFSKVSMDSLDEYIEKTNAKEVGIYKVDEDSTNWADYKHVDLSKGVSMAKPEEESEINS